MRLSPRVTDAASRPPSPGYAGGCGGRRRGIRSPSGPPGGTTVHETTDAGVPGLPPATAAITAGRPPHGAVPASPPAPLATVAGPPPHEPDAPMSVPVHLTSTYGAGGDLEYGRY